MKFSHKNKLVALVFLGTILLAADPAGASASPSSETNLLLVTVDTLRPDRLSCYVKTFAQTPAIDAVAERGVVFERAFAHNPMTLPSHANIMLGATPLYHGVSENSRSVVADEFLTLAEHLKSKGYATGAFLGAFTLDSRFGLTQGFDIYDDAGFTKPSTGFFFPERKAEKVIASASDWLKKQKSPWFCWVHVWDPHAPYSPPEPFRSRRKNDLYSGEVEYADFELGKLFSYLEKTRLTADTLIVLTGDHGESLGEHGESSHSYFAYNSTLSVPLIISGKGVRPGRTSEIAGHIDLFPTMCELLAVDKPRNLQGISLVPAMKGKKLERRPIYFESLDPYYNRGWAPLRGIIEDGKKFIESPILELYDLTNDFNETNNLAAGTPTAAFAQDLEKIKNRFSYQGSASGVRTPNRETRERLKSLGYAVTPVARMKETFGPEDDLKTLLPIQQKFYRAALLNQEGRTAESVKLLTELTGERKDFAPPYGRLSEIYASQGLNKEALDILNQGVRANPKDFSLILAYGILLVKQDMPDQGIRALGEALSLFDRDPEPWHYIGIANWKKGDFPKALEAYEKALAMDQKDAVLFGNVGALYFSMSLKNKRASEAVKAIEYYQKAAEIDPALASAHNGLGAANRALGRIDEAIGNWEKCLELNPQYDLALYNLAAAYLDQGNKSRALESIEKYLALRGKALSPREQQDIQDMIRKCKEK